MRKIQVKLLVEYSIVVLLAVASSYFTVWLLDSWVKYPLFLFEVSIIIALYLIVSGYDFRIIVKTRFNSLNIGLMSDLFLIASALGLLTFNLLQIEGGLIQMVLALLCIFFFLGYALLNMFGLCQYFGKIEKAVLSFALGFSFTSLLSLFALILNVNTRVLVMIGSFIGLGLMSALKRAHEKKLNSSFESFAQKTDVFALLLVVMLYVFSFSFMYPSFALLHGSDIQQYYANSVLLVRTPELFNTVPELFFNSFQGAVIFIGKGTMVDLASFFPLLASSLAIMCLMLPIAVYIISKQYLASIDNRLPILSTIIWSVFSGFSWVYLLKLKLEGAAGSELNMLLKVNDKSNGLFWYLTIKPQVFWFGPYTVSFIITIIQLFLIRKFSIPKSKYTLLFAVLTVVSFFTHTAEVVTLSIFFSLYSLIASDNQIRVGDSLKAFSIGFMSVGILWFPISMILQKNISSDFLLSVFVPLFMLIFASFLRKIRIFPIKVKIKTHTLKIMAIFFVMVGIYVYGSSLLTWLYGSPAYTLSSVKEIHFVPWFLYSILLGGAGLLAILALPFLVDRENSQHSIRLFVALFIFSLFFGRLLSYVNVYVSPIPYNEDRILAFSFFSSSIVASTAFISLNKFFKQLKKVTLKKIGTLCIIAVITVYGLQTTFMELEYWSIITDPKQGYLTSEEEFKALNFLSNSFNYDKYSIVASVTQTSSGKLYFSSPPAIMSHPNIVFGATRPEMALVSLKSKDFSHPYLYIAERDVEALNQYSSGWMVRHLIPMLPTIYNDDGIKIYNVSSISFPTADASTALIIPFDKILDSEENWLFSYDLLSQGGYSYNVLYDLDTGIFRYPTLILSFDPPQNNIKHTEIELLKSSQIWTNIFGNWQFVEEGLHGSGGQPGKPSESSIISSISPEGAFNVTSEFKVSNGDLNGTNYVSIIYDWIDPADYKAAGLCLTKDGNAYAYFATYKGSEIKVYPSWPGANTGLRWKFGDSFELALSVNNAANTIYVNGSEIYSTSSIPYFGGKIGLRVTRAYDVLFTKASISTSSILYLRPVNEYLKYVEDGGTLIILNTNGEGYFANRMIMAQGDRMQAKTIAGVEEERVINLPSPLYVEVFMPRSTNLKPLAYYSSNNTSSIYAIEENLGKGKIVFLHIYPIISSMKNSVQPSLFYSVLNQLLMPIDIYLDIFKYAKQPIIATFKEYKLSGKFEVNSTTMIFPKNVFLRNVILGVDNKTISLENVTRLNVLGINHVNMAGIGNLTISNGLGFYSQLQVQGNVSIEVIGDKPILMLTTEDDQMFNVTATSITITIKDDNFINFILRQPQISGEGINSFKELYTTGSVYQQTRCNGKDLSNEGKVRFRIYVSDTYTWVSSFEIQGMYKRIPPLLIFDETSTISSAIFSIIILIPLLTILIIIAKLKDEPSIA